MVLQFERDDITITDEHVASEHNDTMSCDQSIEMLTQYMVKSFCAYFDEIN